jgi:predicted ATPase
MVQGEATFVDLGSLTQGSRDAVIVAVARALGTGRQTFDDVVKHLRRGRQLLVLDTCEAAIEEVAQAAEMFFMEVREVGVLATSREPLRVEGESVYRIAPLSTPMTEDCRNAQDALRFSAVQLFVQRAAASQAGFALTDEDAPIVGAICRRLDGMALAIELAAGRMGALGVKQIDELLATEFALTWPGRRTAVPRHQTLNATINWSHELLTPLERIVFRRLATFAGPFAFEAAVAIANPDSQGQAEAAEALSNLVSKSLVNADRDRGRYRLLDAARAYGLRKLALSGEEAQARRWHARHFLERLVAIRSQPPAKAQVDELTANIRTALEWAFGPSGDLTSPSNSPRRPTRFGCNRGRSPTANTGPTGRSAT